MARDPTAGLRAKLHEVIFEADTAAGQAFDVALILSILTSVTVVMLDSIATLHARHADLFYGVEWFFTILFTIEYALRLVSIGRPLRYATSFYGIVDLLGILPTYVSLVVPGTQYLLVVRILRVLRVFRVLRLAHYVGEASVIVQALRASRRKITVFLFAVVSIVVVIGALMYLLEGEASGFTSIPRGVYWAVVTLTTVGYGDISPDTPAGQALAAVLMILGYAIIAVPTGIVTVELSNVRGRGALSTQVCPQCAAEGHAADAVYCRRCGAGL